MRQEILKYLGHAAATAVDDYTNSLIDKALAEVEVCSNFRYIYEKFDEPLPFMKGVAGYENYLENSPFLLCATTLGVQIDRRMQRLQLTDMAYATVFDAAASIFLETKADEFEKTLGFENLGFRFCPGYSGSSFIDNQEIAKILKAEKIGITFLESGLMVPLKSMVGIVKIPVEETRQALPLQVENETRQALPPQVNMGFSCEKCAAKGNCSFRRNGTFCYGR